MSNPVATRPLGRSGLEVSQLGFGTGPLGGLMQPTASDAAQAALDAAHRAGLCYVDTAPLYGFGLAERRVGDAFLRIGRDQFVISTKVGRILKARGTRTATPSLFQGGLPFEVEFDFSYDGVMRSLEDSLQRLGTDRVDFLLVHDINRKYQGDHIYERVKELMSGGYDALEELRDQGVIRAFGAGINDLEICTMLLEAGDFDCFMIPGRYTLLDQSAHEAFLPKCLNRGINVLMAAPFESGILATGAVANATYNYEAAKPDILTRVRRLEDICRDHGVSLAAAALQFPLRHPAVSSVVVGMRSSQEVAQNVRWFGEEISGPFWKHLKNEGILSEM
jgi:D-threo-aldose 1-dehydrogenase